MFNESENKIYIPTEAEIIEEDKLTEINKKKPPMQGKHHTEETKKKLREANEGQVPWNKGKTGIYSVKTLKHMSEAKKGNPSNRLGKPHSEQTKVKMREAKIGFIPWNKGIPRTVDEKRKMSEANKGHVSFMKGKHFNFSEEYKRKNRESRKGKPSPCKGIPRSEKVREKMRMSIATRKYHPSKLELSVRNELARLNIPIPPAPRGVPEIDLGKFKGHCYDFVIESKKTIIEVNGCWQHVCKVCKVEAKTEPHKRNVERDQTIREAVKKSDWKLIELWQHEIDSDTTIEYLLRTKAPQLFKSKEGD